MSFNDLIEVYVPVGQNYAQFMNDALHCYQPFDNKLVGFVDDFSRRLFNDAQAKLYPDLMSLAFWMRKSQVLKLKETFEGQSKKKVKVARGLVFHIAPSNVDTIFIYSLFISLLLGNRNIVRISSKGSAQQSVLLRILNELLDKEFVSLKKEILIINYPHDDRITSDISLNADVRIIWGGDNTINQISKCLSRPTCIDLKFANKYSYSLIDASVFKGMLENEVDQLVKKFVDDSYWFGQQACSSPRTIIWLNPENNEKNIDDFWDKVERTVQNFNHEIEAADFVNKFIAQQQVAIEDNVQFKKSNSNLVTRIQLNKVGSKVKELNCGSGLFYELYINALDEVSGIFERSDQTLSYFGINISELTIILTDCPKGIDRVVPVGTALEFSHVWDGYDFLQYLTREIQFK